MAALLVALALASLGCPATGGADGERERSGLAEATVTIRGQGVEVEIARTKAEQALGLGERDALAWGRGMIFPYERAGFYGFWMKGMRFDIDIVWIRELRIVAIDASVPHRPGPEGRIPSVRPPELVDLVLEVPAGYSLAQGWRRGDRVTIDPPLP